MLSVRRLHDNHLEFTATHRAKVTPLDDAYTIESDRPEFTYAVLGRNADRELLDRFGSVRLLPLSGPWEQEPEDARFEARGALGYMTFEGETDSWPRCGTVEIRRVQDTGGMDDFSHVQAASFAQKPDDYERWYDWLRAANHRNLDNSTQIFYVGYVGGKPVGSTLLVMTHGLGGIYGVGTLPEHRKQGIGTSIMALAIADARSRGNELISLQVFEGSYAESLYRKLGFETRFRARLFGR